MSRSGYHDDLEPLELGRWRGRVASTIRGRKGQAFLREMLAALNALPKKRLALSQLEAPDTGMPFQLERGDVCAMGSVGRARQIDMSNIDPDEADQVAGAFGITEVLAREIADVNDRHNETPEARFVRVRKWVERHIASNDSKRGVETGSDT